MECYLKIFTVHLLHLTTVYTGEKHSSIVAHSGNAFQTSLTSAERVTPSDINICVPIQYNQKKPLHLIVKTDGACDLSKLSACRRVVVFRWMKLLQLHAAKNPRGRNFSFIILASNCVAVRTQRYGETSGSGERRAAQVGGGGAGLPSKISTVRRHLRLLPAVGT